MCEKCKTAKPVDEAGVTIAFKKQTPEEIVHEVCELAMALPKFDMEVSAATETQCQLRPAATAAFMSAVEPLGRMVLKALRQDMDTSMALLEQHCNTFSNGLQLMPITAETLEWLPTLYDSLVINLQADAEGCLAFCQRASAANERIETQPVPLVPLHDSTNVATRSPLMVFKMSNSQGKEAGCVAIHFALNGDIPALRPADSSYFYLEIARFHAK